MKCNEISGMQMDLKMREGGLELSFAHEKMKINKWMRKTNCSEHIRYSAKVSPKT